MAFKRFPTGLFLEISQTKFTTRYWMSDVKADEVLGFIGHGALRRFGSEH
jgi:hypothetical protein